VFLERRVNLNGSHSISKIVANGWKNIQAGLFSYFQIEPKLYTYRLTDHSGYQKRLHLRVGEDGDGILFVDVTDVIHLNKHATEIIKLALEDVSEQAAGKILQMKYRGNFKDIQSDVHRAYQVARHLVEHSDGCNTCALTGLVDQAPLFSLPTNAPYKIDIALTYGCNNQCPHCYNEAGRLAMPSLPLQHWFQVFDKVYELGIPHVILTGGEATLHPDFIEIVRYADSLGMVVGLNSNGRYLSHQPFMKEAASAGLNHVQVTLGSHQRVVHNRMMGADSFHQTVRGIKTALESGVHAITNTTLMRSNKEQIQELLEFLYDLGIRTFAMNGMIYAGGGFDHPNALHPNELPPILTHVREFADELGMRFLWYTPTEYCRLSPVALGVGSKKCNAGEYSICIEPNGDVLPCQSYYVSAGNILHDPWDTIWRSELFLSFREREDAPEHHSLPEKCWHCPDLLVCGAGCRIEREAEQGVRVAELAGAGCIGCSGYNMPINHQPQTISEVIPLFNVTEGGFVPPPSLVRAEKRSSGQGGSLSAEEELAGPGND
jgi:radical SAM protein with 4Fe4S-binding SPASM domain